MSPQNLSQGPDLQPVADGCGEVDTAHEIDGEFIVTGLDPSVVFESTENALNFVATSVKGRTKPAVLSWARSAMKAGSRDGDNRLSAQKLSLAEKI
jgi:hypothetical protein